MNSSTDATVTIHSAPTRDALFRVFAILAAESAAGQYWRHQRLRLCDNPRVTLIAGDGSGVLLTELEWDTARFGFPCARLEPVMPPVDSDLPAACVATALDLARARGCRLLHARFPFAANGAAALLIRQGAIVVDRQLTLSLAAAAAPGALAMPAAWRIRPASTADVAAIAVWLPVAFTHTRFIADPCFPRPLIGPLYRAWLEQALADPQKTVLVLIPADGGPPAGFCISATDPDSPAIIGQRLAAIDLIAIAPPQRGNGLGYLLTAHMAARLARTADTIEVRTQADNYAALNAFRAAGFHTFTPGLMLPSGISLHWWNGAAR